MSEYVRKADRHIRHTISISSRIVYHSGDSINNPVAGGGGRDFYIRPGRLDTL